MGDVLGWIFFVAGVGIVLILVPYVAKYEGSFFYWGLRGFRRALDDPPEQTPDMERGWPTWLQWVILVISTLLVLVCVTLIFGARRGS